MRPQDEDQPMSPDDVQASEEVGDEEAIPAKALPSPTQPTRKEIQEHVLTHLPPRSWSRHCLRERGTSLPHRTGKLEEIQANEIPKTNKMEPKMERATR